MTSNRNFVSVDYLFRGKENRIMCYVDSVNTLKLEIEEKSTNLEWFASFSTEYIEELTKKTGNFKSFDVFVAMLQTVLTQNCESLSLDLMSYSDLEELRKLKMGSIGLGKTPSMVNNDASKQNKRYLILTYTTDFDKIHYPLPLTFQGVPDVKSLKDTILSLRRQIYNATKQGGTDYERFEIAELNKKIIQLKSENDQLHSTVQKYKSHFQTTESNEDLKKELKAVKSIVHSLEEELSEEKAKHQRVLMRKNRENKTLIDEVSELKASKRNLNFRVHNLTNELAMYKRQRSKNGFSSPRPPVCPSPKSSFDLLVASSKAFSKSRRNHRSGSPQMFSDPETTRIAHQSRKGLSYSFTDRSITNPRRCSSADRYRNTSSSSSKFDPTAYVEQQKLKRKEIQEKRKRELRSRLNSNNYSDHSRDSSPVSYRNIHTNNNRTNLLSSSNASSMSNLDEKLTNKSRMNSATNKYNVEHLPDKKRLPTPLNNDSDYEASDNESAYKFNHKSTNRKIPNGFKSDDSSILDEDNFQTSKNKTIRRQLLDSEEEIESRSNRISKSNNISENQRSRKSRLQQNNANKSNNQNNKINNNYNSPYRDPSDDINDIDRRLNALQSFFQKYLHDE